MDAQPKQFITPEEYLQLERAAETKSEYFNGEIEWPDEDAARGWLRAVKESPEVYHLARPGSPY